MPCTGSWSRSRSRLRQRLWPSPELGSRPAILTRSPSPSGRENPLMSGIFALSPQPTNSTEGHMQKDVILTPEGLNKLNEELEHLSTAKRREIAERIKEAREFGDISENSEYD